MDWIPDWRGQTCAVVASGQSATPEALAKLRGRCRMIVVNTTYRLAPWADALYAADGLWWRCHPEALQFAGMRITADATTANVHGLHLVKIASGPPIVHRILSHRREIGHGGNSGFQAINIAVLAGAKRLLWLGLDYRGEHWHGNHPVPLKNARPESMQRWACVLDKQAPLFVALGIEVVNLSPLSLLSAYPQMSTDDALDGTDCRAA